MSELLLNDLLVTENIKDALFNMDVDVAAACDGKAREICLELFPGVDFSMQENIDLIIRPLSSVIALNEMVLQNLFSESTLDGIVSSTTLPKETKVAMLKNFAALNGILGASSDPESLYSEISFYIKNNNINNESILSSSILSEILIINRIFFSDAACPEMVRNKINYIQLDHLKIMDFNRSEFNRGTLIDGAYSREDYQTYQAYKDSEKVVLSGMLDMYFSTIITEEDIIISSEEGMFNFPEGYYVNIKNTKSHIVSEDDLMIDGITKFSPSVWVEDALPEETFTVIKYTDPMIENYTRTEDFVVNDVMFKGFFPMFIDFDIYSKMPVDILIIKGYIDEYLDSISGSMSMMSINDLHDFVKARGYTVTFAAKNHADLFASTNTIIPMEIVFPVSMKDVVIPPELTSGHFSERTIKLFTGLINVTQE